MKSQFFCPQPADGIKGSIYLHAESGTVLADSEAGSDRMVPQPAGILVNDREDGLSKQTIGQIWIQSTFRKALHPPDGGVLNLFVITPLSLREIKEKPEL